MGTLRKSRSWPMIHQPKESTIVATLHIPTTQTRAPRTMTHTRITSTDGNRSSFNKVRRSAEPTEYPGISNQTIKTTLRGRTTTDDLGSNLSHYISFLDQHLICVSFFFSYRIDFIFSWVITAGVGRILRLFPFYFLVVQPIPHTLSGLGGVTQDEDKAAMEFPDTLFLICHHSIHSTFHDLSSLVNFVLYGIFPCVSHVPHQTLCES